MSDWQSANHQNLSMYRRFIRITFISVALVALALVVMALTLL